MSKVTSHPNPTQVQPNAKNVYFNTKSELARGVDPREMTIPGYDNGDSATISSEAKEGPEAKQKKDDGFLDNLWKTIFGD